MPDIRVDFRDGRGYLVRIGRKISLAEISDKRVFFIRDKRLAAPKIPPGAVVISVPSGEPCKSFAWYEKLLDKLIAGDDGSPMTLVAYGGGTVGDLVGFCAATYRRGVPFIQAPTTLLAMVDASVGGKTAINHPKAKNMIGAFHQPSLVVADLDRLKTLPKREFRAGLAEVVKHGLLGDERLFLEMERDPSRFAAWNESGVEMAVERSVRLKAAIVMKDERESKGVREFLNLGHTLGHAVEAVRNFKGILHGEAVAIGMAAAFRISRALTGFSETERAEAVMRNLGLPIRLKREKVSALVKAARLDKKRKTGRIRMTLLERIGKAVVVDGIDEKLFEQAALEIGASR